jgi:hypothetical protein
MPALILCTFAVEQLVQWRYGAAGTLALGVFTVGHRARNVTLVCVGLVAIALLITH